MIYNQMVLLDDDELTIEERKQALETAQTMIAGAKVVFDSVKIEVIAETRNVSQKVKFLSHE